MSKVLVACEESQRVTSAFRELGYEAYSCDVQEPSGGHPEWHIMQDVLPLLKGDCKFMTMDGQEHKVQKWDLLIAHPPCTYLSNAGTSSFSLRCTSPEKVVARCIDRAKSAIFFMRFLCANANRIAIENPVGFMNTAFRKPDQIIHPYMFANSTEDKENYVTKATCLWLVNLPILKCNNLPKPDNGKLFGYRPSGKAYTWVDKGSRSSKIRSKTFPGIAKAMAAQWGPLLEE